MLLKEYEPVPVDESLCNDLRGLKEHEYFLDIETTGFSPEKHRIYLIGAGMFSRADRTLRIRQYFAENRDGERKVLEAFHRDLPEDFTSVTYNGTRFDLPFIAERCRKNDITCPALPAGRDLFLDFRPLKKALGLPSLSEKSVERFLGIRREDRYDGGALIKVYHDYEKTGSSEDLSLLLLHNMEDVRDMLPLFRMYRFFALGAIQFTAEKVWTEKDGSILFSGATDPEIPASFRHEEDTSYLILEGRSVKGALLPARGSFRSRLTDRGPYVYLLQEEKVIPEKLARFIPQDRKRRARPNECYTVKEGAFLPVPAGPDGEALLPEHVWKRDEKDRTKWILLPEELPGRDFVSLYVQALLRNLFHVKNNTI